MQTYRRNIKTKLTLLRATFFLTIGFSTYLFLSDNKDYSFVLLFLLACGSGFPVTGLRLTKDALVIRQYYIYGLFPRTWTFQNGDNIEVIPFDLEISDAGYLNTDEWWDIFIVLLPISQTTIKKYIIKHTDIIGNTIQIKTKLTDKELKLIQNHLAESAMPITSASCNSG